MSVYKTESGKFGVRWREAGKHCSKLFATEAEARIFDKEKHLPKEDPAGITVSELCQEYHLRHQVTESTSLNDKYKLSRFIMPILGDKFADLLSTRDLDLYVTERLQSVKRQTVARELRLLKAAMSWGESQQPPLILRNQIRTYKLKSLEAREIGMPPTDREIQRILSHAAEHLERAIKLLWFTGMRPGGELLNLTWQDVDFANGELRIVSARKGGPALRMTPIRKSLLADLQAWLAADRLAYGERVWRLPIVHWQGQRVQSIKGAWKQAKQAAGITREIRLYDLRHAFASNTLRAGGDLKSVSEILGHSRPDTTLREYQHVVREQHREIVELVPDLGDVQPVRVIPINQAKK